VVVDVPVTREDAIPFSGSSSYYAAVAAMVVSAVETMDVEATMIVFGSSCFSSAVADAAETMDVVSASQIICSEMAVGYSGRPIRFIKKNVSACYGRDVFVCQPNLRTLCVLIPCSMLTALFPDSAAASSSRRFHIPLATFLFSVHIPHLSHKHCFHQ